MVSPEQRHYLISGELSEEDWKFSLQLLGRLGLIAQLVETGEPRLGREVPSKADAGAVEAVETIAQRPLAGREEFLAYADSIGAARVLGGRAWAVLTMLYDHNVNAAFHRERSGPYYDLYRYRKLSPLIFHQAPPEHASGGTTKRWRQQLNDLDVWSLARQLDVVDMALRDFGRRGISEALGSGAGPKIVAFLRRFVADVLPPQEADQKSQAE
jgi:hypothetical protein